MIDYYKILGVRRSASKAEIRSAYRKLAKTLHPDFNAGSPAATREFALLSKAYHVLIDPQERVYYDERLSAQASAPASILHSNNQHARRARNLAVQARWDRIVDEVLDHDRRENVERQRAVFTTVSLFLSTFFLAMLKPHLWDVFDYAGRAIVVALFVIGSWHLITRLREYFAHYTYKPTPIQASIMRGGASRAAFQPRFGLCVSNSGLRCQYWCRAVHRLACAGFLQRYMAAEPTEANYAIAPGPLFSGCFVNCRPNSVSSDCSFDS